MNMIQKEKWNMDSYQMTKLLLYVFVLGAGTAALLFSFLSFGINFSFMFGMVMGTGILIQILLLLKKVRNPNTRMPAILRLLNTIENSKIFFGGKQTRTLESNSRKKT